MKFPYIKLITGIERPIIPFEISYKNAGSLRYYGLIDSGADHSYFGSEMASPLGIDLYSGRKDKVVGINGLSDVYFHPITLNIGGNNFNIEAGFMKDSNLTSLGYGLLGQVGLFDQCSIKFSRRKFEIEINPTPIELKAKKK